MNSLFHSHSAHRNVGRPIRLRCISDIIHGNNGDQESRVIEAVYRRLGYAGLKPGHETAVRSFVNGQDVSESLTTDSGSLNASLRICSRVSLSLCLGAHA